MNKKRIMNHINRKTLLFLIFGMLAGFTLSNAYVKGDNQEVSTNDVNAPLTRIVKEGEAGCPISNNSRSENAIATFLPVSIKNGVSFEHEALGKEFDPLEFSEGLYNYETGQENSTEQYPWYIEDFDSYSDLGKLKIYYGNTAMNHTPHVAYVVNESKVIFVASGANINVDRSSPNGLETTETLDWNIGKYKRTKFKYVEGKFTPVWYQISCRVE